MGDPPESAPPEPMPLPQGSHPTTPSTRCPAGRRKTARSGSNRPQPWCHCPNHGRRRPAAAAGSMDVRRAGAMRPSRLVASCVAVLGVLSLIACTHNGLDTTRAAMRPPQGSIEGRAPPAPAGLPVPTAPVRPPPVHAELVPLPPLGGGPVVWQPGHWDYTGAARNPWGWHHGHYARPPHGDTTWVPGWWSQEPNGSWIWLRGHWA